jgi:hypothetical protein
MHISLRVIAPSYSDSLRTFLPSNPLGFGLGTISPYLRSATEFASFWKQVCFAFTCEPYRLDYHVQPLTTCCWLSRRVSQNSSLIMDSVSNSTGLPVLMWIPERTSSISPDRFDFTAPDHIAASQAKRRKKERRKQMLMAAPRKVKASLVSGDGDDNYDVVTRVYPRPL